MICMYVSLLLVFLKILNTCHDFDHGLQELIILQGHVSLKNAYQSYLKAYLSVDCKILNHQLQSKKVYEHA